MEVEDFATTKCSYEISLSSVDLAYQFARSLAGRASLDPRSTAT